MGVSIRMQCPNCGHSERSPIVTPFMRMFDKHDNVVNTIGAAYSALSATICYNCNLAYGLKLFGGSSSTLHYLRDAKSDEDADVAMNSIVAQTFPVSSAQYVSDAIPEKIRGPFRDILEDVSRRRNAPGVMSISRGCLDVALKELNQRKGSRVERLNNLMTEGKLTVGLSDWAKKLWKDGSDAVHDLEATNEQAAEHVEFLKLFFEVVFVLPDQVRRARIAAGEVPQHE